jgi:YbbR domain-containing protein
MKTGRLSLNSQKFLAKIIEKWPAKVLSVAAAIIIAVSYRMNTLDIRHISVPLNIEASETLAPANSFARTVRVSLRGDAGEIQPILEEDIEAYIDLKKITSEGSYRIPVQIRKKGSALGVEPLEISVLPLEIPLILEQKVRKTIPVMPVYRGTIAQGYELTSQSITPETVIAEGPRSSMDAQLEFTTDTIDLEERYGNFSGLVNIVNNNPLIFIHGNTMIEYRGTIRRITRDSARVELAADLYEEVIRE